jgi:hypothetical protein
MRTAGTMPHINPAARPNNKKNSMVWFFFITTGDSGALRVVLDIFITLPYILAKHNRLHILTNRL